MFHDRVRVFQHAGGRFGPVSPENGLAELAALPEGPQGVLRPSGTLVMRPQIDQRLRQARAVADVRKSPGLQVPADLHHALARGPEAGGVPDLFVDFSPDV
jgi:hypothetical protein